MGEDRDYFAGSMIMISRLCYAINWFNISPALYQIGSTFNVNFALTGLTLSLFLAGAGIFQVPAGIVASRIGAKRTAMAGMLVLSISVIISGLSYSFYELLAFRFIAGIGAAFFFSSGIGIVNDLYKENVTSMIGIYNGFFSVGGGIGIFLFTPIVAVFGWRADMYISGILTLIVTIVAIVALPKSHSYGAIDSKHLLERITDKTLWLLALGFDGLWALNFTFSEYFKPYVSSIGVPDLLAGLMGGVILFSGILGGYLTGFLRRFDSVKMTLLIVVFVGTFVLSVPFVSVAGLWSIAVGVGTLSVVVISTQYGIIIMTNRDPRYIPLNLGLVNSIQIGFGSIIPYVFAFLQNFGYEEAWLFLGIYSVSLLPLVVVALRGRNLKIV